jgi:hypothetical protein
VLEPPDDDPVVPGGVLGDDLAVERRERVGKQRCAALPGRQSSPAKRSEPAGAARFAKPSL